MTPEALQQTERPQLLNAVSLCVGESTYKGSAISELDHALVSQSIVNILVVHRPNLDRETSGGI